MSPNIIRHVVTYALKIGINTEKKCVKVFLCRMGKTNVQIGSDLLVCL